MKLSDLRTKLNKSLSFMLALLCVLTALLPCAMNVTAAEKPAESDFAGAECVVLYNMSDGIPLIKYNADKVLNTSTSAKIMTGLVLCERLSDSLDDKVEITKEMLSSVSGMRANPPLQVGETLSVRDLLYAAICGSYNDAAYVLAYYTAGSISEFVKLMNDKAKSLGAESTTYTNPLGFPDNDSMKTTGEDVLKIAIAAAHNELYMQIASAYTYDSSSSNLNVVRHIKNRVTLVNKSNSMYHGMNAGYSGEDGGWSVITSFEDEGHNYISIVLGGDDVPDGEVPAYEITKQIAGWASGEYSNVTLYKAGEVIGKTKVNLTALPTNNAPYAAKTDFTAYIPKGEVDKLEYEITPSLDELKAPIKEGEVIGTIKAIYDGKVVGECEIVMTKDYDKNFIVSGVQALFEYTQSRAFVITIVLAAVCITIYIVSSRFKRTHFNSKMRK